MDGKDVAQIITAIAAPLLAAAVAFGLNRSENHRRSVRDLFFGLTRHVDDFRFAMYEFIAHSLHVDILARMPVPDSSSPPGYAESRKQSNDQLNEHGRTTVRNARQAVSTIHADQLLLKMLYKKEQVQALIQSLDDLTSLADPFLPNQKGGRTPEYAAAKELPVDAKIDAVRMEVESLWTNTIYPAALDED